VTQTLAAFAPAAAPASRTGGPRLALRIALAAVYAAAGVMHLSAADKFALIVPPVIPFGHTVVLLTGACEIAGALGLMLPPTRRLAGVMLALYALCVWPANIYQALWHVSLPPIPDSWWYHGPRLAFQPVIIWWALYAGGVIAWPFGKRPARR
jgi:uncharacterized membrane protein